MDVQHSLTNIDSALFQLALQSREISQKKNELNRQIKIYRADIAERTSYIESVNKKIVHLEEETKVKQTTVTHNKANAKSMMATNSLLLQYEQTLKAELESRKDNYSHDMEVYEERLRSYREIFQSHKEYYHRNPLAQKLLTLQAEKEAIECRIKGYDEQITVKQKKLDHPTAAADSSPTEEPRDNVSDQQPTAEPEKQTDPQREEDSDSYVGTSCLRVNQTKNDEASAKVNAQEEVKDSSLYPEEAGDELSSYEESNEPTRPHETHTNEQDKEMQDQVMEEQTTASEIADTVGDDAEDSVSVDEDPAPSKGYSEALADFPDLSSQETGQTSTPAKKADASSTLGFNFSPTSFLQQNTSPAFPFTLNSGPTTPAFSGFDIGAPQDEVSSFAFTSSLFTEKKTSESKSLSCSGFLFDQPEQNEDFQFPFTSKSPLATKKDNSKDEFPFSFNF